MTALDYGNFDDPENLPIASSSNRSHAFAPEAIFKSQACAKCGGRIKPNTMAIKCISCNPVVHGTCGVSYQAPCKPAAKKGTINDYLPPGPPMIPTLVVDCIRIIQSHDMPRDLYIKYGHPKIVNMVVEAFRKTKKVPKSLVNIDVHTVASILKEFFNSLTERLIDGIYLKEFTRAIQQPDRSLGDQELHKAIEKLPQPNLETLVLLIQHLQKFSENSESFIEILAGTFGPLLVGKTNTTKDFSPKVMRAQVELQMMIVKRLLQLNMKRWTKFLDAEPRVSTQLKRAPRFQSNLLKYLRPQARSRTERRRSIYGPQSSSHVTSYY